MTDRTLDDFAVEVGASGPVTITGGGTRGGPVAGVRTVRAPAGIVRIDPAEMVVECGAATPVDELLTELERHGQTVALPAGGTVGGALAVGRSAPTRLAYGPMRDVLLRARYVDAAGVVITAGGPTVKNVSGFDLCRLLVGSWGTLGFLGEVLLRTRPVAAVSRWYRTGGDPFDLLAALYRPTSILWDGSSTWVLLEGAADDLDAEAARHGLESVAGPPALPTGARWSLPPDRLAELADGDGEFVAEIGVGVVHHARPAPAARVDPAVRALHDRIKAEFDPQGRLNPGLDVLAQR